MRPAALGLLLPLGLAGCIAQPAPYYPPYSVAPPSYRPYPGPPAYAPQPMRPEPPPIAEPLPMPDPPQGLSELRPEPPGPGAQPEESLDPVTELLLTPLPQRDAAQSRSPEATTPAPDKTPARDPFMGFRPMRGQTAP